MAFVLQDAIKELEACYTLKKENLAKVAEHFGITPAVGATKPHILDLIEEYCIDNDIINEVDEKFKLEFQREEQRLPCKEAQKPRDAEKALQDAQLTAHREARD